MMPEVIDMHSKYKKEFGERIEEASKSLGELADILKSDPLKIAGLIVVVRYEGQEAIPMHTMGSLAELIYLNSLITVKLHEILGEK